MTPPVSQSDRRFLEKKTYSSQELEALWDIEDKRSLPNIMPTHLGRLVADAYQARPDLFLKNEDELLEMIPDKCRPKAADRRLRLSFWEEYHRVAAFRDVPANTGQRLLVTENIIRGVCTRNWFLDKFMSNPEKVAFLVCPPASYLKAMEEALMYGIDKIRSFLELPEYRVTKNQRTGEEKKVPIMRVLELKTKIAFALASQAKGSIIKHQVETKNMHLIGVMGAGHKALPPMGYVQDAINELTMEELDKQINKLEKLAERKTGVQVSSQDSAQNETIEAEVMVIPPDESIDEEK